MIDLTFTQISPYYSLSSRLIGLDAICVSSFLINIGVEFAFFNCGVDYRHGMLMSLFFVIDLYMLYVREWVHVIFTAEGNNSVFIETENVNVLTPRSSFSC